MPPLPIRDPLAREAVAAIDAGDVEGLARLLADHPDLVRRRIEHGEGYFRNPYLLCFVARNPVRVGVLHPRVTEAARAILLGRGADPSAYGPPGFHPHATALHQAVCSGSLDAVRALVEAGADGTRKDRVWQGTPLDWAEHCGAPHVAAYLRGRARGGGAHSSR